MKVTIITPCYNSAPYIATTIKSVQQQTFTDWEMIIVDDGSTDNSATIVSEIAKIDLRIKLIQKDQFFSYAPGHIAFVLRALPFWS